MDKTKKDALRKTYKQLSTLIDSFDEILEPLRMAGADSPQTGARKTITAGTSQILFIADTMQHTADVHGLDISLDFIREQFAEIAAVLDAPDYPTAADTLEFELMPMLCEWFDELDAIFGDAE